MVESEWAELAEYGARFEADIDAATLRAAGIPVMIKDPGIGIFGPGHAGTIALGVRLFVPRERLDEAAGLLEEEGTGRDG